MMKRAGSIFLHICICILNKPIALPLNTALEVGCNSIFHQHFHISLNKTWQNEIELQLESWQQEYNSILRFINTAIKTQFKLATRLQINQIRWQCFSSMSHDGWQGRGVNWKTKIKITWCCCRHERMSECLSWTQHDGVVIYFVTRGH